MCLLPDDRFCISADSMARIQWLARVICPNMVKNGELRFIYWGGGGGGPNRGRSDISSWVISSCKAIQGFEATTQNAGAPDGTGSGMSANKILGWVLVVVICK